QAPTAVPNLVDMAARMHGAVGGGGDVGDAQVHPEEPIRGVFFGLGDLAGRVQVEGIAAPYQVTLALAVLGEHLQLLRGTREGNVLHPALDGPNGYRSRVRPPGQGPVVERLRGVLAEPD